MAEQNTAIDSDDNEAAPEDLDAEALQKIALRPDLESVDDYSEALEEQITPREERGYTTDEDVEDAYTALALDHVDDESLVSALFHAAGDVNRDEVMHAASRRMKELCDEVSSTLVETEKPMNEYERKRELLRMHNLTREEAERIANATGQKDPRDRYESMKVPVSIEDGEVDVGSIYRIAGNETIRWNDNVVGTFGAAGETPKEIKRAYKEAKARWIKGLHDDEQIAREFGDL